MTGLDALAFAGDLNCDGYDDLLLGDYMYVDDPDDGVNDGAAYLFFGPVSGSLDPTDSDAVLVGSASDHAGEALAGGSDLDGDGDPDVLIAGPSFPDSADNGVVYIRYDAPEETSSLVDSDARIMGGTENDRAGHSVAMAGDVNGDVIVGAPCEDVGDEDGGAAFSTLHAPAGDDIGAVDAPTERQPHTIRPRHHHSPLVAHLHPFIERSGASATSASSLCVHLAPSVSPRSAALPL